MTSSDRTNSKGRDLGKVVSTSVDSDLARLRSVPPVAGQRPLATTKATLARRMVEEGGYLGYSVDGVARRLSSNGVPRRPEERRALFEALACTMQAELDQAGLQAETDYSSFITYTDPPPKKKGHKKRSARLDAAAAPLPAPREPAGPVVLCVGAHPDDIELGAGVLVQRCLRLGYEVHFLVLTDERGMAEVRREEATKAAQILGIPAEQVHFAGFRDGKLKGGGPPVGEVRRLLQRAGIFQDGKLKGGGPQGGEDPDPLERVRTRLRPSFVVTHTQADSHGDHCEANKLVRATFRETVILRFSVHTSIERSAFAPRFFVRVDDDAEAVKAQALSCYESQRNRIDKGRGREAHEQYLGELAGLDRAEASEVDFQAVEPAVVREVMALSDAPFHQLWGPILADGEPIYQLHETFLLSGKPQPPSIARFSRQQESEGRRLLREAFNKHWWPLKVPLSERVGALDEAVELFESNHILLLGGAVSNNITATFFNRFADIDWVIECDQPGSEPVYLLQKSTGQRWWPAFLSNGDLDFDVAVLSVVPNPSAAGKTIVACAGVHGRGTEGLLAFLADPSRNLDLLERVLREPTRNIPVRVHHHDLSVTVLPEFDTGIGTP